ncbi:MAG: UDP-glucose 4-epimerase GalE [Propionibacteriaceae bacterium]|jgi:UDP-glucose 4-epimerase|nr:UDP-glucose 4-epimerase GalE [Propionibacteriaceae bacterium]
MTWLVTGGAGYIGAHIVRAFLAEGIQPVVLDDLSSGHREFVPEGVPLVVGSVVDEELTAQVLGDYGCDGIAHLAGFKYAGVSVQRPLHTYTQNVTGIVNLLAAARRVGVDRFVFSSSAGVYGTPTSELVTEDTPTVPESPYGESKLVGEWVLRDLRVADPTFRTVALRYFNVVGSVTPEVYDTSPHNLFPLIIAQLRAQKAPRINGDDYPTPDGTCVRDYVHVGDLAVSHVAAAQALSEGRTLAEHYNLGSGMGLSVRQIMDAFRETTGIDFTPEIGPRRPGDPARIVAAADLAARDINWANRHSIQEMTRSAWEAACAHGE